MNGLVVAAPRSGSGKTTLTLGLLAALNRRGLSVAPAKTGPDYIDTTILARAAGRPAINLDPWAMSPSRLHDLAVSHAAATDLLLVEGVMGLFDGAADGRGSTADLAATLGLPVILVLDAERQSQSIAALAHGFATWRPEVKVAGLIVNRAASTRHELMLRAALSAVDIPLLGVIPKREALALPDRHLGLVLPGEIAGFDTVVATAAEAMEDYVDLNRLLSLSSSLTPAGTSPLVGAVGKGIAPRAGLPPLGQHIAIARDDAFAFLYPHWLADWREAGASLSFFSPLADEAPDPAADAVFLPGGYPELHAARLAAAENFMRGLRASAERSALIYGECGGFMVLGASLTDKVGATYPMSGLLPHETRIDRPKRVLGYRRLVHQSPLPFPQHLAGHEFHYSSARKTHGTPLFSATDALGEALPPMGLVQGRVLGSYAHVIDVASRP
ncbi:MAG TPA: cobyrinate a,c-diamide synthase [Devosia sp.]|jgi:cobyrinic acid a,c-diamide synthase|uniref:cobyrinate a,c-diamide synthase n=1 Tax=Devosia sp. TaxID=1871048 RepID=UPI002DDD656D|nr:cobyrinate a,c-diamide synthase [Devosia sp.]HEV2518517.1 cobyrinate a,c-diamide synthase [Devosia sp.]